MESECDAKFTIIFISRLYSIDERKLIV